MGRGDGGGELNALEALAREWLRPEGKEPAQAAWDERKARLALGAARAARRLERLGGAAAGADQFLGLFALEGLLRLARMSWVAPAFRRELASYMAGLGQELGEPASERSEERHEWMRFEVAEALLSSLGRPCGAEAGAGARAEWESAPRGLGEWAAWREREALVEWLGWTGAKASSGGRRL